MSRPPCTLCDQPSVAMHHLTGRLLDPLLEMPLCHDHHWFVHDDWWTAGVGAKVGEDEPALDTLLHGLAKRLRRIAMFLGRLAEMNLFTPLSALLAEALACWADDVEVCIDRLDNAVPCWQSAAYWDRE